MKDLILVIEQTRGSTEACEMYESLVIGYAILKLSMELKRKT